MQQYIQDTKYVAETISILIDFSDMLSAGDTISGVPTTTITVFSGLDPSPADILYLSPQVHNGIQVEQYIWRGIPGVLYTVSIQVTSVGGDTFEKECFLGILQQDGSAVSPIISFYYTSRPYPIEYAEIIQSTISPNYFHLLLNPRWIEDIKSTISPQYINILLARIFYNNYIPEEIQSTISPQSGLLIGALITYNNPHEDIKVSIAPLSGLLPVVRVFYLNYMPEQIKSSITPQSGTLV